MVNTVRSHSSQTCNLSSRVMWSLEWNSLVRMPSSPGAHSSDPPTLWLPGPRPHSHSGPCSALMEPRMLSMALTRLGLTSVNMTFGLLARSLLAVPCKQQLSWTIALFVLSSHTSSAKATLAGFLRPSCRPASRCPRWKCSTYHELLSKSSTACTRVFYPSTSLSLRACQAAQ